MPDLPPPNTAAFWQIERGRLRRQFTQTIMTVLLAGGQSGASMLPAGTDVLMNWDTFNEAALDWLRMFVGDMGATRAGFAPGAFNWVDQLTATTRRRVVSEIENWVQEGAELRELEARLTPLFGEARARMIATTEVTRIYASGNLMAWQSTGVIGGKRWMTAVDERVCPVCGPLHNRLVELDGAWQFTPEMLAANPELEKALRSLGTTFTAPPAHVNCRCWLQPVVFNAMEPEEIEQQRFTTDVVREFFAHTPFIEEVHFHGTGR